jgi:PAS domain S-box-containing protein
MVLDGKEVSDWGYSLPGTPCEKTCEWKYHVCTDDLTGTFPEAEILRQFRFTSYCGTAINNSDGQLIGVICVLSRKPLHPPEGLREIMDIIAGKAGAEIERAQIEYALRQSEEKFRLLVNLSLDGIIIIDKNGILLFANQAAGKIFEVDVEELLASGQVSVLEYAAPESCEKLVSLISRMSGEKEPYTINYEAVTATGRMIWIEGIGKEVFYHEKPAILFSLRDVTRRNEMEQTMLQTNKQLNLLSSITRHDILNMIMVIKGYLEVIQIEYSDPGLLQFLQKMRSAADMIKAQIEFTRFYQEISSHAAQWLDLVSCIPVDRVPEGITLEIDLSGITVYADQMLGKIFFNLLDNSIRHGLFVSSITVGHYLDGQNLVVIWEDNVAGIPGDQKERIFELGMGKNTGFGLFLIREILSLTGITIRETGKEGFGARFELIFPRNSYKRQT